MSSHDTAAGRHEPAELVLGALEARMAESGLRAHIYLTEHSVVEFVDAPKANRRASSLW